MKKAAILLMIFFTIMGCHKDGIIGVTVKLIEKEDPIVFKKSVILFNNNNYSVKTPLDTFILGFPFNSSSIYDDQRLKAINDSSLKDVLYVNDYLLHADDSVYTLAYYLATGKCLFYDKHSKENIKTVLVETFQADGSISSFGGRRFYINNKLFLEAIDFMSFLKSPDKQLFY